MEEGRVPSVLAISWGKGNPKKDEIQMVFVYEESRLREPVQYENPSDPKKRGVVQRLGETSATRRHPHWRLQYHNEKFGKTHQGDCATTP